MASKVSVERFLVDARGVSEEILDHLQKVSVLDATSQNLTWAKIVVESVVDLKTELDASYQRCVIDEDNIDEIRSIRAEINKNIITIKYKLAQLDEIVGKGSAHDTDTKLAPATDAVKCVTNLKLSSISIGKFTGDVTNWVSFNSLFKNLVYDNPNLSNVEKYILLLDGLDLGSKNLLRHLPVVGESLDIAYSILVKRYECKRLLINSFLTSLENIPKASGSSHKELRNVVNCFVENLAGLKQINVDLVDVLLFNMFSKKLDSDLLKAFELENAKEVPTYEQLMSFIEKHCKALEVTNWVGLDNHSSHKTKQQSKIFGMGKGNPAYSKPHTALVTTTNVRSCLLCDDKHYLYHCKVFLNKTPQQRYNLVKEKQLCINCLLNSHHATKCPSKSFCKKCNKPHNTLLHFETRSSAVDKVDVVGHSKQVADSKTSIECPSTSSTSSLFTSRCSNTVTLLATANISIRDGNGKVQSVRALLDNGSMESFMTETCRLRLGLPKAQVKVRVDGLGLASSHISGASTCKIRPCGQTYPQYEVEVFILPNICGKLPTTQLVKKEWPHINNLKLADPNFNVPGNIDLLLSADVFAHCLLNEIRKGSLEEPVAIKTIFGWVLTGKVASTVASCTSLCAIVDPLDASLSKFWKLESIPESNKLSPSEEACEQSFVSTHSRDSSGRFMVSLPFSGPEPTFLDSYGLALKRFLALERRLQSDPQTYSEYKNFMQDYIDTGHMSRISTETDVTLGYYIPHHAVLKPDSSTTKLRVVFDASAVAPVGGSLNDHLLTGPPLQKDIIALLLHFRLHTVVLTSDIKQMYRQIWMIPKHRIFQKILWRSKPSEPIEHYQLNTVTYGVKSAPYLALRVIQELAHTESLKFPVAASVLASNTYVDDLVTGCSSVEEAKRLIVELDAICKAGGFILRKWNSNVPVVLEDLPEDSCLEDTFSFGDSEVTSHKILGLRWQPLVDSFIYDVNPLDRECTKRNMVSEIARIFDPLGLLAPLVFFAKRLIQYLWIIGIGWDEHPPMDVTSKWLDYLKQLSELSRLIIPRWILCNNYIDLQLHGFSDASDWGYAAVVYFRMVDQFGNIKTFLVCAKSRVAPVNRISIPRLELCAAVLLANLINFVQQTYKNRLSFNRIFAWSDSTITLSWIRSLSHQWKTFVGNRISHIQSLVPPSCWHYVKSSDNPADCASRGILALELVDHPLWWTGPHWLHLPNDNWPSEYSITSEHTDSLNVDLEKRTLSLNVVVVDNFLDNLLNKYSDLQKICRIIAYVQNFIAVLKTPSNRSGLGTGILMHQKEDALHLLVRRVQQEVFGKDIKGLETGKPILKQLRSLSPFVDSRGLLRVGGRLRNSELPFSEKFPILLPRCHRLTELVILDCHQTHLHPGLKTTQFLITQNFWILSAKRAIRQCLKGCIRCFRVHPIAYCPPMGDLPPARVTPGKPFLHTGMDFGGPCSITMNRVRGSRSLKAYICVFVCFSTKAIHLELVSNLSKDAFIGALRRFIARRGKCIKLYSDCGTNFIGASTELASLMKFSALSEGIEFVFNPPASPHFGGLWEAGIKSVKSHLKKAVGDQLLSYEELNTVLVQIEAILNSRPLCPLNNNPDDFSYLTPSHCLGLEPVSVLPDPSVMDLKLSVLDRWQLVQRIQQSFWHHWHTDYLNTLQQKTKWLSLPCDIKIGTLVLIKEDNLPSLSWRLGRVESLYFGSDNKVRVATVKTAHGVLKRPLVKLCPLPLGELLQ